jgi:hypothetical protein
MAHYNEKKIERAVRRAQWVRDQKDRKRALEVVDLWNARLAAFEDPLFVPTIRAALISGHHWMIVVCRSCGTIIDLDLQATPARGDDSHGAWRRVLPALQRQRAAADYEPG